jgi:hypothetical protein
LTGLAWIWFIGCSEPTCCIDNYPPAYALLYGTVRLASQAPAANTLVRAGDGVGVRTDSAGKYRLPTTIHGISRGQFSLTVTAFRADSLGRLVDSSSVQAQTPFFDREPPRDSARVDVVVPWSR